MEPLALTGTPKIIAAIILGGFFGYIIVKTDFILRPSIKKMLELKNLHFLTTFIYSIAIGGVLFYFAYRYNIVSFKVAPVRFWGIIVGGILTGIGLSICGQIPITSLVSLSIGRVYSAWVIAGMCIAVTTIALISRWLKDTIYQCKDYINVGTVLEQYINVSHIPLWISAILIITALILQITLSSKSE